MYEVDSDGPPTTGVASAASSSQVRCSCAMTQLTMPSLARISFHEYTRTR